MKTKIHSFFISFLTALIIPLSLNAMDNSYRQAGRQEGPACMVPRMTQEQVIHRGNVYREEDAGTQLAELVQRDIKKIQNNLRDPQEKPLNAIKASGILGEEKARQEVEGGFIAKFPFHQGRYISIFTLFTHWNCEITSIFRNGSDNGIDDIFITPSNDNKWSLPNLPPIFHEAKYRSNGRLELTENETICDQLSHHWIGGHLELSKDRASGLVSICSGSKTLLEMKLPSCNPCYRKIEQG